MSCKSGADFSYSQRSYRCAVHEAKRKPAIRTKSSCKVATRASPLLHRLLSHGYDELRKLSRQEIRLSVHYTDPQEASVAYIPVTNNSALSAASLAHSFPSNPAEKTWKDGHIRHHHYNSKTYLLAEDGAVLAETFYRPPAGGSKQRFSDDFVLDGEVEFETGYLVDVGDLVWKGSTVSRGPFAARRVAGMNELTWLVSTCRTSPKSPKLPGKRARRLQRVLAPGLPRRTAMATSTRLDRAPAPIVSPLLPPAAAARVATLRNLN